MFPAEQKRFLETFRLFDNQTLHVVSDLLNVYKRWDALIELFKQSASMSLNVASSLLLTTQLLYWASS